MVLAVLPAAVAAQPLLVAMPRATIQATVETDTKAALAELRQHTVVAVVAVREMSLLAALAALAVAVMVVGQARLRPMADQILAVVVVVVLLTMSQETTAVTAAPASSSPDTKSHRQSTKRRPHSGCRI